MNYDYDSWQRDLRTVAEDCVRLLERKQRDYGPKNIASAPGGPVNGLMVRMYDKIARIENLNHSGVDPENESLLDSFMDLANYGIIGVMVLRGMWPGVETDRHDVKSDAVEQPPKSMQKHLCGFPYDVIGETKSRDLGLEDL